MTKTKTLSKLEKLLMEALIEAQDHLEYCGYGDPWERECAETQGLEGKIERALEEAGYDGRSS